jgi:hypothetical protein
VVEPNASFVADTQGSGSTVTSLAGTVVVAMVAPPCVTVMFARLPVVLEMATAKVNGFVETTLGSTVG